MTAGRHESCAHHKLWHAYTRARRRIGTVSPLSARSLPLAWKVRIDGQSLIVIVDALIHRRIPAEKRPKGDTYEWLAHLLY